MSTYLLTCKCGNSVPVEVGQAGGQVACSCGQRLDVPTLRQLRHLPRAKTETAAAAAAWNVRKGVISAAMILAGVLLAVALGSRLSEPSVPTFPANHLEAVQERLKTMSPADAWQLWVGQHGHKGFRHLAETGFSEFQHPHAAAIEQDIARRRLLQTTLLILAGVCIAVIVAAAVWPRSAGRRG